MDTRPGQTPSERPFFTFRSIAVAFAVAVAAAVVSGSLSHTQSTTGALTAVIYAIGFVAFIVAWIGGLVFAWRARSVFWFFAVCFLGPIGSLVCAWFLTAAARARGGGHR